MCVYAASLPFNSSLMLFISFHRFLERGLKSIVPGLATFCLIYFFISLISAQTRDSHGSSRQQGTYQIKESTKPTRKTQNALWTLGPQFMEELFNKDL